MKTKHHAALILTALALTSCASLNSRVIQWNTGGRSSVIKNSAAILADLQLLNNLYQQLGSPGENASQRAAHAQATAYLNSAAIQLQNAVGSLPPEIVTGSPQVDAVIAASVDQTKPVTQGDANTVFTAALESAQSPNAAR